MNKQLIDKEFIIECLTTQNHSRMTELYLLRKEYEDTKCSEYIIACMKDSLQIKRFMKTDESKILYFIHKLKPLLIKNDDMVYFERIMNIVND
jgi:hypothetical protein